ncbi:LysM peptidoglycan-binding domain-containing protein [Brevibacillus humidisoli]|uniref:cell division suppressor protein YneA n=1 Tax=Brevibacillus humidisoli TaxID=2895522 RepID=UPI001E446337|nr:LysM peptidoglycan-binding domain-containing protein [Brevibacillus humidisoli]UFJ42255.1 LysM peptidoglycan-binding domain-containing protein [Brevibacillus humidisoli]
MIRMNHVHSRYRSGRHKGRIGITRGQALLILLACSLFFSLLTGFVFAAAEEEQGYSSHKLVTVQPGDSVWELAVKYQEEAGIDLYELIDAIKTSNDLPGFVIYPGQNLIIPLDR